MHSWNLSITPERLEEIMQTYEVGSLWYRRDILGERCIAQGLCYEYFANNTKEFIVKDEIIKITVGVDFGGSLSATTSHRNNKKTRGCSKKITRINSKSLYSCL